MWSRPTALALAGLLQLAFGAPPAVAQAEPADPAGSIARLALLELRGDLVSVRYSAGALQRATQVQDPFELLVGDFGRWSGRGDRLAVLLLSREEWERAGIELPYGLPARVHGSSVAAAAWGDPRTVDLWGRLLGWDLPFADDAPMRSTADEAASLVATDLLGLFEGARILIEQAGYSGTEPWIREVLAHTVAATVIARTPGSGIAGAVRMYGSIAATRGSSTLPISAYRSGLSLQEWLWFQARFFDAARLILEAEKRNAGKSIIKMARKKGGPLSRADLVKRYSALNSWLVDGFAPNAD